ncbi:MAG: phosphopyruvate hydratase [Ruminococcaceae bacterium]|nr:phosphopyruvate hydratase [Oscillospiraceae bacterium]
MLGTEIAKINALEILDSRAAPTVFCKVTLACGAQGCAAVPSGASRGKNEAFEKRDGGERFGGRGVEDVCRRMERELFKSINGADAANQKMLDGLLLRADGFGDKRNYGANALLAVSLACARATAQAYDLPLYRYLGGIYGSYMPVPMMNVLNGGAHAANNIDIQEFMLVPTGASSYKEGVRMCAEIYALLKMTLKKAGLSIGVGDEGGFAPDLKGDEEAVKYLCDAIDRAGYSGKVKIALDIAASEWVKDGNYVLPKKGTVLTADALIEEFSRWTEKYPIISLEDPVGEEDIQAWEQITRILGKKTMLVGDDLFVTDAHRVDVGAKEGYANSVLIKPNQTGTLTETFAAVNSAKRAGYKTIISHRSGDTADDFISDLAVAVCADFIKAGAPARGERVAKYNRILEIEKEVNSSCFLDK